jgi:hypothetical protein
MRERGRQVALNVKTRFGAAKLTIRIRVWPKSGKAMGSS